MVRKYDPDYSGAPMLHPNYGRSSDYTAAELRNLRAHYCAEAELVDRWVGRVLQKVDDLGLWENTVVIFTTDHGMSLGEHGRTGKTNINEGDDRYWPLYPEIAHIPFLIAAPGVEGGREVGVLGQPADVLPTLVELTGVGDVDPPEPFHGRSLAPAIRGENTSCGRELAITAQFLRGQGGRLRQGATTPVLYTDEWAYAPVGPDGQRELYAIQDDPCATQSVAAENPAVADQLHRRLVAWLRDVNAPSEALCVAGEGA